MSDIVIVSKEQFHNGNNDRVPYGTVLDDSAYLADNDTIEGVMEGAVPAVDWRGIDQVDTMPGPSPKDEPVKRKPGRPKGSKNKVS